MGNKEQQGNNKNYEDYLQDLRKKLDEIKIENERILGRNTLAIAGGAFALSVTLIKEIYPNPLPWSKWILIASWALFGLCAFLQIYSDHLSSKAVDIHRQKLDDYYLQHQEDALKRPNKYDTWVKSINGVTHWLLFLGFFCMIVFSAANFLNPQGGKNMGCQKKSSSETASKGIQSENSNSGGAKKGVTMPPIPQKPAQSPSKPLKK